METLKAFTYYQILNSTVLVVGSKKCPVQKQAKVMFSVG